MLRKEKYNGNPILLIELLEEAVIWEKQLSEWFFSLKTFYILWNSFAEILKIFVCTFNKNNVNIDDISS